MKRLKKRASFWYNTRIKIERKFFLLIACVFLTSCGSGPYDVNNATDRAAMKIDIKQALTKLDCTQALSLSTLLYQSNFVDNDARLLYASAHGCNIGIQLFSLLDNITTSNFGTPNEIIKSLVRIFPSSSGDSKMQSSWFAQDALQSMLNGVAVIAPADVVQFSPNNKGSVSVQDHTNDANAYLLFIGLAGVGTVLNRYGYAPGQSAVTLSYKKGQSLPWTTLAAVQTDTTGVACALTASFFNMFDGIYTMLSFLSGATSGQLSSISTLLSGFFDLAGKTRCGLDGFSVAQCNAAAIRIRYRGACTEQAAAASFAAGVIGGINGVWL